MNFITSILRRLWAALRRAKDNVMAIGMGLGLPYQTTLGGILGLPASFMRAAASDWDGTKIETALGDFAPGSDSAPTVSGDRLIFNGVDQALTLTTAIDLEGKTIVAVFRPLNSPAIAGQDSAVCAYATGSHYVQLEARGASEWEQRHRHAGTGMAANTMDAVTLGNARTGDLVGTDTIAMTVYESGRAVLTSNDNASANLSITSPDLAFTEIRIGKNRLGAFTAMEFVELVVFDSVAPAGVRPGLADLGSRHTVAHPNFTQFIETGVVAFGDSITVGVGDSAENGFIDRMAQELLFDDAEHTTTALASAQMSPFGLTSPADDAIIAACASNITATASYFDASLMILDYGTNDFNGDVPIGAVDDATALTFYGAANVALNAMVAENATADIVLVTPPHRTGETTANGAGHTLEDYRVAIRALGTRHNITVVEMGTLWNDATNGANTTDGLHPNDTGHAAMAAQIATTLEGALLTPAVVPYLSEITSTIGAASITVDNATQDILNIDGSRTIVIPPGGANITTITPAQTTVDIGGSDFRRVHGAMLNPLRSPESQGNENAFDERVTTVGYDAAQDIMANATNAVVPGDIVIKAVSKLDVDLTNDRRDGIIDDFMTWHFVSSAPATEALPPAQVGWTGRGAKTWTTIDWDALLAALPSYDTTLHSKPTQTEIDGLLLNDPIMPMMDEVSPSTGYEVFSTNNISGSSGAYGRNRGKSMEALGIYLLSDATDAQKRPVLQYLVSLGRSVHEAHSNTYISKGDGGHYRGQLMPVLWYLWATGQESELATLGDDITSNQLQQYFRYDATILAALDPHDVTNDPHVSRRRTISSVSGTDISVPRTDSDPTRVYFTGLQLVRESDGAVATIQSMATSTADPFVIPIDAQPTPAFAASDVIYARAPVAFAEGQPDWTIKNSVSHIRNFAPSPNLDYRGFAKDPAIPLVARALGLSSPDLLDIEAYVERTAAGGYPTYSAYPSPWESVTPFVGDVDWAEDFWADHAIDILPPVKAMIGGQSEIATLIDPTNTYYGAESTHPDAITRDGQVSVRYFGTNTLSTITEAARVNASYVAFANAFGAIAPDRYFEILAPVKSGRSWNALADDTDANWDWDTEFLPAWNAATNSGADLPSLYLSCIWQVSPNGFGGNYPEAKMEWFSGRRLNGTEITLGSASSFNNGATSFNFDHHLGEVLGIGAPDTVFINAPFRSADNYDDYEQMHLRWFDDMASYTQEAALLDGPQREWPPFAFGRNGAGFGNMQDNAHTAPASTSLWMGFYGAPRMMQVTAELICQGAGILPMPRSDEVDNLVTTWTSTHIDVEIPDQSLTTYFDIEGITTFGTDIEPVTGFAIGTATNYLTGSVITLDDGRKGLRLTKPDATPFTSADGDLMEYRGSRNSHRSTGGIDETLFENRQKGLWHFGLPCIEDPAFPLTGGTPLPIWRLPAAALVNPLVAASGPTIDNYDQQEYNNVVINPTFSSRPVVTDSEYIDVAVMARNIGSNTSCTIGGTAATRIGSALNPSTGGAQLITVWRIDNPGDVTSVDVVLGTGTGGSTARVTLLTMCTSGSASPTLLGTTVANGATTLTHTNTASEDDLIVAMHVAVFLNDTSGAIAGYTMTGYDNPDGGGTVVNTPFETGSTLHATIGTHVVTAGEAADSSHSVTAAHTNAVNHNQIAYLRYVPD